MLNCALKILVCSILSFLICLAGVIITLALQGEDMASSLFVSWVKHFNGVMIAGFGWGVVWYGIQEGKKVLALLINFLNIPEDDMSKLLLISNKATSWKHLSLVTMPVSVLGAVVLLSCGFPLEGFAKVYLTLGTISLYLAAAIGFGFVIYTLWLFKTLDERYREIAIDRWAMVINFETLNTFFIISATVAVAATYLAFRGTLSANFTYPVEFSKVLLAYPLILFMPILLIYSFYPRYVFRKIFDHDIFMKIVRLDNDIKNISNDSFKDKLEMEKTLAEVKEKLMLERKSIPIVSYKDTFSILFAIIMTLQFILQRDTIVSNFINLLTNVGLK